MRQITLNKSDTSIILVNQEDLSLSLDGFDPSDLLAAALAKCTAGEVRKRASRHDYDLQDLTVRVDLSRDREAKTAHFLVHLEMKGNLSDQEIKKLYKYASKSYIRRILSNNIEFKADVHYNGDKIDL